MTVAFLLALLIAAQPVSAGEPAPLGGVAAPAPSPEEMFREGLSALREENPEGYFLLGEEVLDAGSDTRSRDLATRLYVIAYALDLARPGQHSLAASCAVALAGNSQVEKRRRWLLALAKKLDPRQAGPEWMAEPAPATADSAAYQVATVLGLVRSGQGGQARSLLGRDEVRAAFQAYDRTMLAMGISGGLTGMEREASLWPCPVCGNQRVVRKGVGNPPEYRLCPACGGDPGPRLGVSALLAQLRFESWLLRGNQQTWAAQLWIDLGEPLLDPEPADLPRIFGVDPALSRYRDGEWGSPPEDGKPKPSSSGQGPDEQKPAAPGAAPAPAAPSGS